MDNLLLILLPFLLADIINPVLLAGVVYTLGSSRPIIYTTGMLASFFLCYFLSGLLIAVGLEAVTDFFHLHGPFDYELEFLLALLFFYAAYSQYKSKDEEVNTDWQKKSGLSLSQAVLLGFTINIIGIPFAVPYLGWIDQLLIADLSYPSILAYMILYNLLYILPFALLMILHLIYHEKSHKILVSINTGFDHFASKYLPFIYLTLGLILLEDCVSYFIGYREYSLLSTIR